MTKQSIVSSVQVKAGNQKELVFDAVEKAMKQANWKRYVRGENIVLKVNAVWDRVYPCVVTSPMVIEGVIRVLQRDLKPKKITIVDTNTSAFMYADVAFRILGIEKLAKKYKVGLVNLSDTKFQVVPNPGGKKLDHLKVSEVLINADCIITMPIVKTHRLSTLTCALKNQWGCIHEFRHNYHTILNQAIADVNIFFKNKITFVVADALVGMEATGPKTGTPIEVGHVFASPDLVALDTAMADMMGFDKKKIKHLKCAQDTGVGTMNYKLKGDQPPTLNFEPPSDAQLAFSIEMGLRHLGPGVEWFLFKTPVVHFFRVGSKVFHDGWYILFGRYRAQTMMRTRWGQMWQTYL